MARVAADEPEGKKKRKSPAKRKAAEMEMPVVQAEVIAATEAPPVE